MAEGLKIQIGADVSQAIGGLKQVETAMQKTVSNSKSFEASVGKSGQALGKIVNPSNQATLALTNLGRVAQDAPFGFLGIANNLNPLLESFQRLKATTGSTGGALKALASSLSGAGGLGFALSIASSLAIVFGDKLFGASKKAEEHKEAIQLVETEYDRFAKRLNEVSESIAKEATSFAFLTAYSNDATVALKLRNAAISEINKNYSSYLSNLSQEVTSYNELSRAIQDNIKYLAVQAELKALLPALNKDFAKAIQLQVDLNQLQRARALGENNLFGISEEDYQKESKLLEGQIRGILNSITAAKKSFEIIAGSSKGVLDALFPDLGKTTTGEIKIKPDKITIDHPALGSIKIELPTVLEPQEIDKSKITAAVDNLEDILNKRLEPGIKAPKINIAPDVIEGMKKARQELDRMLEDAKFIAGSISNAFGQAFDQIAKGGNVFKSIGDALKALILDLIKAAIQALIFRAILSAIPGGAAASSAGAAGRLFGLAGFRARGGPVAGGSSYIVGEEGPELFTPSVSGSIIPNNQIGSFSGRSQMATVRVTGRLRGNDMILQNARTNRMQTRLG